MVKPDIAFCMDMSLKFVVEFKNLFWLVQTQIPTATQLEYAAEFMMDEVSSISIGIFQRFCYIDCSIDCSFKTTEVFICCVDMCEISVSVGSSLFRSTEGEITCKLTSLHRSWHT